MVNRVVIVGRLTRDPEMRTTSTGKSVVDISIAVTKKFKPQDGSPDADFFRVNAWDKTAEYISNYLTKGRLVAIDGRLSSRKFTAKDGTEREVVEIVAESVQSLDRPKDDAGGSALVAGGDNAPRAKAAAIDEYDPFADE
jgi:single-strand DNA-binding protein